MSLPMSFILRKIERWLWLLFFLCAILFMVSWSFAQVLLWGYSQYNQELEQWLERKTGYDLVFSKSHNQMQGINPLLSFSDLSLVHQQTRAPLINIRHALIELDTVQSLWHVRPVFKEVVIDAPELTVRQKDDFSWAVDGLEITSAPSSSTDSVEINRWIDLLFYQGHFELRDAMIHLYQSGEAFERPMELDLSLTKDGDLTVLEGEVKGKRNPVDFSFRGKAFQLPGEPEFDFDMFIHLNDFDSLDWADQLNIVDNYQVDSLKGGADVWVNWNREEVSFSLQGHVSNFSLLKHDDQKRMSLSAPQLSLSGRFSDDYCSVHLPEVELLIDDASQLLSDQAMESLSSDKNRLVKVISAQRVLCDYAGNWWWTTPSIVLQDLLKITDWLPASSDGLKQTLETLSPQGALEFPVLWLSSEGKFRLESQLQQVSVSAWNGAPGLKNITGQLVVEDGRGYTEFLADETELNFPEVFTAPLLANGIEGRVDWWFDEDSLRVNSRGLTLNSSEIDALVGFAFEWDYPSDEARLGLDISISEAMAGQVPVHLPTTLDTGLLDWLNGALAETAVSEGRLLVTLTLDPAAPVIDTVQIDADLSGKRLTYHKDWPAVEAFSGHFLLDNEQLLTKVEGVSLGNPLSSVLVHYPNIWDEHAYDMNIEVDARSRLSRLQRFIYSSPLADSVGPVLKEWTFGGEANLATQFSLNMDSDEVTNVSVRVQPLSSSVLIPGLPEVTQLNGVVEYTSDKELFIDELSGKALGGKVVLSQVTTEKGTELKGNGIADVDQLLAWQSLPLQLNTFLEGLTDYSFQALIDSNAVTHVKVYSDLQGVVSSLPAPMSKVDKDDSMILVYQGELSDKAQHHVIDVGALNLDYQKNNQGKDRTVLSFGHTPKESRIPDKGTFVFGRLNTLDMESWVSAISTAMSDPELDPLSDTKLAADTAPKAPDFSLYTDLSVEHATLGDLDFHTLSVSGSSSLLGHRVAIRSRELAGTVRIPSDDSAIDVKLDYFLLPESDEETTSENNEQVTADQEDPLESVDPASIPAVDIQITRLKLGDREVGSWRGSLKPVSNGVLLTVDESRPFGIETQAQGWWTKVNGRHVTFVDALLTTNKLQDVYKSLGYAPNIESDSARVEAYLEWNGSPVAFNKSNAQGLVDFSVKDGRFLNVSDSAETLKVFGLFNLNSWSRRLKLDFSDVYSSGLAFDSIQGTVSVNDGVVETESPIELIGPGSNMLISGETHLDQETLDYQMRLVIPVSGTLPLAVVVAGVAPIVGGLMLLGQGVWGGFVDQFTGVDYQISGTWDDPVMEATSKVEAAK